MTVSVIGVVGAGFMGSGIAESAAAAGKHVIVYEPNDGPFERSRESLGVSVGRAVSRGKLDHDEGEQLVDRVLYTTRFEDLGGADAVIVGELVAQTRKPAGTCEGFAAQRDCRAETSSPETQRLGDESTRKGTQN